MGYRHKGQREVVGTERESKVALSVDYMVIIACTKALFSSPQKPKSFQNSLSHQIFWHMH
jgi:hypothetical protein